ncbi:Glyoxalase/Bleomycin resistance protein/Dihydroxybiphenyl dioxygenase [Ilyonectria robusta]|uniref:Glyoxalase/Bleomycin resistance protein/Dihydroxybiphenyl dioxygenase n=1 Tax=Ilyonectria robusta TaxID=1079257 RepID=UPI001E8EB40A|nr:Glyoxalase/Bleomycin resistance protein/Dihydroxybiphenyl dioxygenase [Ilyonectria robusta]KAH8721717.1 Glyoxalase/Bleomycin resistance protein/Dihydroxybiphenyl dioxygenase [Ilyonectria robusta]
MASPTLQTPSFALNHVAISVPNIDAAIEWYKTTFGMTVLMPTITLDRSTYPTADVFKVYPTDCNKLRTAFLGAGSAGAAGLELFEFEDPKIESGCTANFARDYKRGGYFHIAITTADVDEMAERVEQNGGKRIGPNMPLSLKHKACYVEDKWGNVIELISGSFEDIIADR